ncbi:hypothetical protein ES703_69398 [subsurface metagenome]
MYLLYIYPFVIISIFIFLDRIWSNKNRLLRGMAVFCTAFLIIAGVISNISLLFKSKFAGQSHTYKGYDYKVFGYNVGWTISHDIDRFNYIIDNYISHRYRSFFYEGLGDRIGYEIAMIPKKNNDEFQSGLCNYLDIVNKVDRKYKYFVYRWIGRRIINWQDDFSLDRSSFLINYIDKKYRSYLYEGMGWDISVRFAGPLEYDGDTEKYIKICITYIDRIERKNRGYVYFGLGQRLGSRRFVFDDLQNSIKLIYHIDPQFRNNAFKGFGWSLGERFEEEPEKYLNIINNVDDKYKSNVYHGLSWCLAWRFKQEGKYNELTNKIDKRFKSYCDPGLKRYLEETKL